MTSAVVAAAAPLAGYLGLVVWLSWPLARHLPTHLPYTSRCCSFDALQVVWTLAWESRALVTEPTRFTHANIYFPAPHALFYGWTSFGALPYFFLPFHLTGNPVLATNLMFIVSVALTAWTVHLVVRRWTGSHRAAFLAAWTLLTTLWMVWGFPATAPSYAVLQYFPLIIFAAAAPPSRLSAVALLALVVVQGLTNVYAAAAVLGGFTVVTVGRVALERDRRAALCLLGVLVAAAVALFAGYYGHFLVQRENPMLRAQTYWGGRATDSNPFVATGVATLLTPGAPTGIPMAAVLLIALGVASRLLSRATSQVPAAAWCHAAAWSATGMFLSQRPVVDGVGTWPAWPLATLAQVVPVYDLIRSPERLGVAGLMGLAILTGLGAAEVRARWPWRTLPGRWLLDGALLVIAVAMYRSFPPFPSPLHFPGLRHPYPLVDTRPAKSSLIPVLQTAGGPVVELPAAPDPWLHSEAMYRSIFHRQPVLNGYGSYWPAGFPERMALADRLPDADALAELRRTTGLAMVLVHVGRLHRPEAERWQEVAAHGGQPGLRLVARDRLDLVFATHVDSP